MLLGEFNFKHKNVCIIIIKIQTLLWNSGNAKGSSTQYKSVPSGYASGLQVVAQTSRYFQKVIASSLWVCDLQAPYSTRTTYLYRHTYHYLQDTCKSSFRQSANCCGIVSRLRCCSVYMSTSSWQETSSWLEYILK